MTEVFVEVYKLSDEEAQVPVQSAICLFLLSYLQQPATISLTLVVHESTDPALKISLHGFRYHQVCPDNLHSPISDCCLPVLSTAESTVCVAGLCAVLRQVLKHSGGEWQHLLGFREGCLFACAEVSLWTKFCEVDVIEIINDLLCRKSTNGEVKIHKNLARLEEHLKQPVRMHNVDKLQKHTNQNYVERRFAEGYTMSLADLMIIPCVYVCLKTFKTLDLPYVLRWYNLVLEQNCVLSALSIIKPSPSSAIEAVRAIVPEVPKHSLYKSDPKRYKPKSKQFTRQEDVEEALKIVERLDLKLIYDTLPFGHEESLDWQTVPDEIQPDVPLSRLERKRQQLENLTKAVIKVARPGDRIIDFCCGSGHLGIVVAYSLPSCEVVLLDNKEQSLDRARARVNLLGLTNVTIIQTNLDYFKGSFQIGMSLHACGVASDLVIDRCLRSSAVFVVCPCCYGSLQNNHMVAYPRSAALSSLSLHQYFVLGHCADQTHKQLYNKSAQGEKCMAIIDTDRCLQAQEKGYTTSLGKLNPHCCSPKNNLLVGVPGTDPSKRVS